MSTIAEVLKPRDEKPGPVAIALSEALKAGFISTDFILTMRNSEINGSEHFDNAYLSMGWHGYYLAGLQNLAFRYNDFLYRMLERIAGTPIEKIQEIVNQYPQRTTVWYKTVDVLNELPNQDPKISRSENETQQEYITALLNTEQVQAVIPYDSRMRIRRYVEDWYKAMDKVLELALDGDSDGKIVVSVLRQYLGKYSINIAFADALNTGHFTLLNGRMAEGGGHKKLLATISNGGGVSTTGEATGEKKKHFWNRGN